MESSLLLWGGDGTPILTSELGNLSSTHFAARHAKGFTTLKLPCELPTSIKSIVSTNASLCILTMDGTVYSWGTNSGHGGASPAAPIRIESLSHCTISSIAAGVQHYLCCSDEGEVYSWGLGGALGHGEGVTSLDIPARIESFFGISIVQVACTRINSFALSSDNKLYAWGENGALLGNGSTTGKAWVPILNACINGTILSIHAGSNHVGVVTTNDIFLWGANNHHQCIPNCDDANIIIPRSVPITTLGRSVIDQLALGTDFTLAKSSDGLVYAWGYNNSGQCGVGNVKTPCSPTQIAALASREVSHIFAGATCSGCATSDGCFFTWGQNNTRQLGHMDTQVWSIPREVQSYKVTEDKNLCFSQIFFMVHTTLSVGVLSETLDKDTDLASEFLKDIQKNFNNKSLCDTVVECRGKKIYASKFILGSRSEYFRAMFASGMEEATSSRVVIDDCAYDAVVEMIRFLHTGTAAVNKQNALLILEIAMKYQLDSLIGLTESYVAQHLTIDNCFPIFHEATRINAEGIRELAIRFILHHWRVLGRSKQLEELPQQMLIELIRRSSMQDNEK